MEEKEVYCIYTDKIINNNKINVEHIIPLSLGGCNMFTIQVEAIKNAQLGTSLDGKLANDFLMTLIRSKNNFKGHSNKEVIPILKNSKFNKIPVQVSFDKDEIRIYNSIEKRILTVSEVKEIEIESKFSFDRFLRISFIAKVLFSAGYYTVLTPYKLDRY